MEQTIRRSEKFPDLIIIERPTFNDQRGFFREFYRHNELEELIGRKVNFVQTNHSHSVHGVLRGIHVSSYDKLLYLANGRAMSVMVDLRPDSPTFKQHEVFHLSADIKICLFAPPGFGNSFYVGGEVADYIYLVGDYYNPTNDTAIRWNDPELNLPWPNEQPIMSEQDAQAISLEEYLNK